MTSTTSHALNAPPWQRVEHTLMTTARDIRQAYDNAFAAHELNLSQASLIGYIAANGPMNQTQLASSLVLGRAATGTVVDQLEKRGLVERVPDPDDRRVWMVENTTAGARLALEIMAIDETLRNQLRSGTTRSERQALADVLLRLSENAAIANDLSETSSTKL